MENSNKKILTLAFVTAGILAALVLSILMDTLIATWGFMARMAANDSVRHGVPVLVGAILFFFLQFNKKIVDWADQVVAEIKKVVWPSRKETTGMTVVVTIMILMSGLVVGVFDLFSTYLINFLVK